MAVTLADDWGLFGFDSRLGLQIWSDAVLAAFCICYWDLAMVMIICCWRRRIIVLAYRRHEFLRFVGSFVNGEVIDRFFELRISAPLDVLHRDAGLGPVHAVVGLESV